MTNKLPGFGVRVRAGGKRTWIIQYRIGDKQRRVSLGRVGILTAENARKQAKIALGKVHLGRDPQTEKFTERARAGVTLSTVVEDYLSSSRRNLKPRSFVEVERSLTRQWAPLAGRRPTSLIARRRRQPPQCHSGRKWPYQRQPRPRLPIGNV